MSQNGQTHFKNLTAFAARFLKCVWPFWDIMHKGAKALHHIFHVFCEEFMINENQGAACNHIKGFFENAFGKFYSILRAIIFEKIL